ncbi:glycerophosphoryl diester phosphodiesterase [Legionella gratiana]|uniref:Glycerophosphoryl diester phosphodiesterase n=1 Tax=Legionella gratiana TaxID=45066 RepID=A0A378JGB5_9GAMM|nr:glycerophosphodiester phosphodiesterase family protein [Legionella gratiana]KTD11889.1 glycerophosphoryl diester phosphodiesterase [Legionella gratiana]STX46519.1 glycerophosphoryl diester phosphodiesterase [Legionella gratiana]
MLLNLLGKTIDGYFSFIPRNKPSQELMHSVRLIAHRGAHNHSQGIIENTIPAFDLAKELGCWGIEFDVHSTADHVLVINHDATLKRLWGHNQEIAKMSFNELHALAPKIPTLEEVIAAYGKSMHLFIELKTPLRDAAILANQLRELSAGEDYHLLTLNSAIFSSLTQFPKESLLLVAIHNNVQEFCNLCINENYGGVLGHYLLMHKKVINQLRAAQKIVGVGMVDSKYSLYRELNRGINWLFTDRAAEMSLYLQSMMKGLVNQIENE